MVNSSKIMEELKSIPEPTLQCIIGVDKRNPSFTVYRDVTKGRLHVYWGQELLEVVNDDRDRADYKFRPQYFDDYS